MSKPWTGNNPLFPALPWREWIRDNIPEGKSGYVAEDLDLIFLRFGPAIQKYYGADGEFILVEIKSADIALPYAQERVFGLIDRLLKLGDLKSEFYKGFYQVIWMDENVIVNGEILSFGEFKEFLLGKRFCLPFPFGKSLKDSDPAMAKRVENKASDFRRSQGICW